MLQPVKIAFGEYLGAFYASLRPTTRAMNEYVARGLAKSIAWAPSRMSDSYEEMLSAWQRNDTDTAPTQPHKLPVIIAVMARDYIPTGREFTRQVATPQWAIIPEDTKERAFGLSTMAGDIKAQLAIFAQEEPTARSIASQFCRFIDTLENRYFYADYSTYGIPNNLWPVTLETPDTPVLSVSAGESKNLVILAVDMTLKATIPLYNAPAIGEYHDGKGVPGTQDPAGYPVIVTVNEDYHEPIA